MNEDGSSSSGTDEELALSEPLAFSDSESSITEDVQSIEIKKEEPEEQLELFMANSENFQRSTLLQTWYGLLK